MKSEIVTSNAEAAKRVEAKRKASLRRLKRRIARDAIRDGRFLVDFGLQHINAAIDAWDVAERKRGTR